MSIDAPDEREVQCLCGYVNAATLTGVSFPCVVFTSECEACGRMTEVRIQAPRKSAAPQRKRGGK